MGNCFKVKEGVSARTSILCNHCDFTVCNTCTGKYNNLITNGSIKRTDLFSVADILCDDCKGSGCFVCGTQHNTQVCSACKSICYCSREHQVADWQRHSLRCGKGYNAGTHCLECGLSA